LTDSEDGKENVEKKRLMALTDQDRELLSQISTDEIKASFLKQKDGFNKRLDDDSSPVQENDFEITTFADEISLIGFIGASAKAPEVCRTATR
jgi:hypothetical protein